MKDKIKLFIETTLSITQNKKNILRESILPKVIDIDGIDYKDNTLFSLNEDPKIMLDLFNPHQYYKIIVKITAQNDSPLQLFYKQDESSSYSESNSILLGQPNEVNIIYFSTKINTRYFRFDPINHPGEFAIEYFEIIKISKLEYLYFETPKINKIYQTVKKNPKVLKKVFSHIKNGNIDYLLSKTKDKIENNVILHDNQSIYKNYFYNNPNNFTKLKTPTDIIIPVYNGYEFLAPLFQSIKENTLSEYRLIVIDDASPDTKVKPFLKNELKKFDNALLIENEVNLGFVQSVNKAVKQAENNFVILNTDTEVPSYWLERLMSPFEKDKKIATTTPFTNAGTIASFPNFIEDNKIFLDLSVEELDSYFKRVNPKEIYEEMPTGVGFCMGVNYALVQKIDFFDEETFYKGYGEENDWCQRAINAGYANIMVPNLFVYHKHGGSFLSEDKIKYIEDNLVKLSQKHPNYGRDVDAFIQKNPYKALRESLIITIASQQGDGVFLLIDHALGGGANHYADDLLSSHQKNSEKTLKLSYDFYTNLYRVNFQDNLHDISLTIESFKEVKAFLTDLKIKEIFINELVTFKNIDGHIELIKSIKNKNKASLTIPIHDFFPICPSYTLLDNNEKFCNIPDLEQCKTCMKTNSLEWKSFFHGDVDISKWREQWLTLLQESDTIICFSNSSKELILKAYPTLETTHVKVIPHIIEPIAPLAYKRKKKKKNVTIGILGGINYAKGYGVIKDLIHEIEDKNLNIKITLIGEISDSIHSEHFKITGRYDKKDLPQIIVDNNIDIFFIPSIWPETFSYTTQEIISMELPIMVFNLGAPAERVKNYSNGYIIDEINNSSILKTLSEFTKEVK